MKIEKNKWVAIHYTLKDENGAELDSSVGGTPLGYVHGNGYLIPGMENALEGKETGDKFQTTIQPKDGYGEYDPQLVMEVEKSRFEFDGELEVGMQFQAMTPQGPSIVTISSIEGDKVKVDANHALAGKVLNFEVEVVEVRDATEEELNPAGCGGGCGSCGGGCGGDCGSGCGGDCGSGGCGHGGCGGNCGCN